MTTRTRVLLTGTARRCRPSSGHRSAAMGDREAISRLYDEVADIVQAQYPHALIRADLYADGGPKLTIQITPEQLMGLPIEGAA